MVTLFLSPSDDFLEWDLLPFFAALGETGFWMPLRNLGNWTPAKAWAISCRDIESLCTFWLIIMLVDIGMGSFYGIIKLSTSSSCLCWVLPSLLYPDKLFVISSIRPRSCCFYYRYSCCICSTFIFSCFWSSRSCFLRLFLIWLRPWASLMLVTLLLGWSLFTNGTNFLGCETFRFWGISYLGT